MTYDVDKTGPPYPPGPIAGSNALGKYIIGVDPIGDINPFNPWQTVISQYGNSPIIDQLILNWDSYLDQTANFDDFYDKIWNIYTAQGYGLDVWGRIVGIGRVLEVGVPGWFGFAEAAAITPTAEFGFNQQAFYSGNPFNSQFTLADEAYRKLILAKAYANIMDGTIPSFNKMLLMLFPNRGNCYVTEGANIGPYFGFAEAASTTNAVKGFNQAPFYDGEVIPTMCMTYTFTFPLTPVEYAIVANSGVLPTPTGVLATIVVP